jgi:hypothetical protein
VPARPVRTDAAWELAVSVNTDVAVPLAGTVALLGSNEQEINPDELEHEKFTDPLNPFRGDTSTLKFADPPALNVAVSGLTEAAKSETCTCAVAVCVIGPLVPVTVIW